MNTAKHFKKVCLYGNAGIAFGLAVWFALAPAVLAGWFLWDDALRDGGVPRIAFWIHQAVSPKYAVWAEGRRGTERPASLTGKNISGTEWPIFGSLFYLWATEAMQSAWEREPSLASVAPKVYARPAIVAATRLMLDPAHAGWVRKMYGDNYLHDNDVFYRYVLVAGMTSYAKLTGATQYNARLRETVDELVADIDAAPAGLLDDYPHECYPADVMAAVVCIRRADPVLDTDHSEFAQRAIRAFQGKALDELGLPSYDAIALSGDLLSGARGCSNSWFLNLVPEYWPDTARDWYARCETHFWQERMGAAGFRELPKGTPGKDWYMDVDAGPCIAGHGVAASAFGVGAARANGRLDHA
jgi:hypothetical protein